MKHTIAVTLENRFGDVERIIGLLSGTGFKIEKMNLSGKNAEDLSSFVIVVDAQNKNIKNILIRLEQLIRVKSVECAEGDKLQTADMVLSG